MTPIVQDTDRAPVQAGQADCWLISDGKPGHESIARGIAAALGRSPDIKRIAPRGLQKHLAPHWPIPRHERLDAPGSLFQSPVPEIVIAIGRQTVAYLRALKRAVPATFTVSLLNARAGLGVADVIWVPQHDRLSGANVLTTLTSPHRFSADHLAALRLNDGGVLTAVPVPRVAVLLGGPSRSVAFDAADAGRFAQAFAAFVTETRANGLFGIGQPPGYLITGSRRTPRALLDAVRAASADVPSTIYEGGEPNPYDQYLAFADALIVTGDSISMVSEAVATGRPVFVFRPRRLSAKFIRFLDALERAGATRPFVAGCAEQAAWSYPPIDPTPLIAAQIEAHFQRHRAAMTGKSKP